MQSISGTLRQTKSDSKFNSVSNALTTSNSDNLTTNFKCNNEFSRENNNSNNRRSTALNRCINNTTGTRNFSTESTTTTNWPGPTGETVVDESPKFSERCGSHQRNEIIYTDVLIIGNGPSALSLSAFLSGHYPCYDISNQHPDEAMHEKLAEFKDIPVMDQDLEFLSEGLEGRTNHGVSLLYDSLVRPNVDMGDEHPSTLLWRHCAERSVSHIVIGNGPPGGSWTSFSSKVLTLSFGSWLDLPALSFRDWLISKGSKYTKHQSVNIDLTHHIIGRIPCSIVKDYYKEYVSVMGLEKHYVNNAVVTCARKIDKSEINELDSTSPLSKGHVWEVQGIHNNCHYFRYRAKRLVLATGANVSKRLHVPNEDLSPFIFHSSIHLESIISQIQRETLNHYKEPVIENPATPVLVVGDGLSAADAVGRLLLAGIPVAHSFRKSNRDAKHVFAKLSKRLYPEYHAVFQLMTSKTCDKLYEVYPCTEVVSFSTQQPSSSSSSATPVRAATLKSVTHHSYEQHSTDEIWTNKNFVDATRVEFSYALISIGFRPSLKFFPDHGKSLAVNPSKCLDSKLNSISVHPFTKRCVGDPTIFALGPLIGDNFVRFIVGGSMAAAAEILKDFNKIM